MARFVSALSGSIPLSITDTHDVRTITDGLNKRSELIASRSAVSTDIYADLETAYQSGGEGTYFPPDTFVVTNGVLTGSVYTSSAVNPDAAGIRTPTNYATRPTASITSTQISLVGPSVTKDSASVTYDVYLSASNAVKSVLDSITGGGPYGRLGQNPSRTLHSIWHDPNLAYFAWDDFSPGTASFTGISVSPLVEITNSNLGPVGFYTFITSSTANVTFTVNWITEYLADTVGTATLILDANYAGTPGGSSLLGDIANDTVSPSAAGPYNWIITDMSAFNRATGSADILGREPAVTASIQFADATIPSHAGGQVTTRTAFSSQIVRMTTLTTRLSASLSSTKPTTAGECFGINTPVFAIYNDGAGGTVGTDNIAGSNTERFKRLYADITVPTPFEAPGNLGNDYWVVQTNGNIITSTDQICKYEGVTGRFLGSCDTNACGT